ncbi:MAG: metallopeptidase TldD-related protein, partial [Firmicutes bacterium]|nr:metallopeptidase TldD-related protein [Bacillota bacterium]
MNKEIVIIKKSETKLNIVNNKIEAVFKSTDSKTGLRIYDGEHIGIAGGIGKVDKKKLEEKAKDMLRFKIPYAVEPTKNANKIVDLSNEFSLSDKEFHDITSELLSKLEKNYPNFAFTESVSLIEIEESLENDCNTNLKYRDKYIQLILTIKHKKSLNVFDGVIQNLARSYSLDETYQICSQSLDVFENKVEITDGEMLPIIFTDDSLISYFFQHLHGKLFAAGASIFKEKVGQKLFSDKFSLNINREPLSTMTRFFDGEGTTLENDKFFLIENGVIKSPFTSKKVAKSLNISPSASSMLVYDAVPDITHEAIEIASSGKTLNELIGNQRAILIEVAAGGDFTAQGEYSTPAQVAYLWENGKRVGRLPQISLSSTVNELFG